MAKGQFMTIRIQVAALAATTMLCAPISAFAADLINSGPVIDETVLSEGVTVWGALGIVSLEANELVYFNAGSDVRLSQLIWQSTAPVLTAGLDVSLPEGWTFTAKAEVAMSGDSYMEDYDWLSPYATGTGDDDWSDRSQHPDTRLDWYFNGTMLLGYNLVNSDGVKLNVNGGLKYTDVQWAAYGGSYVYSDGGYRNDVGNFPDGEKGITYRQMFPAIVAGLDGEVSDGDWTFAGGAHAGLTFSAKDDDRHWMRTPPLQFLSYFQSAPLVSVEGSVAYKVSDGMQLYLSGTAEQIFTARGDTDIYNNDTGNLLLTEPDAAGADLFAATLSVGIKGTF